MEELPSSAPQTEGIGNVANVVLIPDQTTGNPNVAVSALQQQIIAIVTDTGQQVVTPVSTVGTLFQDIGQDINSTFTQAMTFPQPLLPSVSEPTLNPLTVGIENVTIGDGGSSDATMAAFEAISVLADASNRKVHEKPIEEDLTEKKVYSSVKASLSKSLVSAILRKSGSLETVLTNIATQLSIKNIVCEFDESTGIYTLYGDIKELSKLQDVLIHYFDENLDFNLENLSPAPSHSRGISPRNPIIEKKHQSISCNILRTPAIRSKSGRIWKPKRGDNDFDANDAEFEDDGDDEYIPTQRAKRPTTRRRREPQKKLRELILEFPSKSNRTIESTSSNIVNIPVDNFTSLLGQVTPSDASPTTLKFDVQHSLLTPKLETSNMKVEDMPAQSNEDVVSLLEKPLEGDDVRKYINMTNITDVQEGGDEGVEGVEAEDFVSKFVDMDTNDLLGDGASDLGGEVDKLRPKTSLDLPPVSLSDEEAMAALEREEVEEKLRVAREKVAAAAASTIIPPPPADTPPLLAVEKEEVDDPAIEFTMPENTTPKQRKNYDSLMPYKYHCTECSFRSKRESHYIKHMKIHRENPELKILKCKTCDFKTIRQCHLKRHQAEHTAEILNCEQCSYKTTVPDLLKKHVQTKHAEDGRPIVAIQHCPKCDYKTTRPYHFERHLRVHADILGMLSRNESQSTVNLVHSYQCPKCPYHTKKKEHFVRHLGDVHSEHRPYLCDTCGKSFKRADALKQHRDVHMERIARMLPYTCNVCKKSFKSRAHLSDHKTIHTNVRAYLCEICGASFKTKSVQRKHIMSIHNNPRAYHCPHCDKRFNTKFALQRHSTTHMVPEGLIRTTDVPITEQQEQTLEGQQETQYIQVEVNPSPQLTTIQQIQTIPLHNVMQMEGAQVQDVIMKGDETLIEQTADGTRIVPQIYSGPGEATTALLYLTAGNFPGAY